MDSEKVKEIKKGLECCKDRLCEVCPRLKQEPNQEEDCRLALIGQSLTLINDLESENEKLTNTVLDSLDAYRDGFSTGARLKDRVDNKLKTENNQLKDRIAELEEYIKGNEQDAKAFVNGWHKDLETELKQFTEKLKEKFNRQEKRFADTVNRYENGLDKVKESNLPTAKYLIGKATGQATMAKKAQYYIDETLKEFIND